MNDWFYNDVIVDESMFPENALGFVYKITNLKTGRAYIGKKLLFFQKSAMKTVTLKNGTKKKKKVRSLVPSDWKTYYGSSPNLSNDVTLFGVENFKREILFFCSTKGALGYWEAQTQMDARVLENQELWYNGIVSCRVHRTHVSPKLHREMFSSL